MDKALIFGSKADSFDDKAHETRMAQACDECINRNHPERCNKNCHVLKKNKGNFHATPRNI